MSFCLIFSLHAMVPSVLWCCWLGGRKGIRPVKNWVLRYWHGYLSGERCKWFAYGPADATATRSSLASLKSRMVYFLVPTYPSCTGKKPLNGCSSSEPVCNTGLPTTQGTCKLVVIDIATSYRFSLLSMVFQSCSRSNSSSAELS